MAQTYNDEANSTGSGGAGYQSSWGMSYKAAEILEGALAADQGRRGRLGPCL